MMPSRKSLEASKNVQISQNKISLSRSDSTNNVYNKNVGKENPAASFRLKASIDELDNILSNLNKSVASTDHELNKKAKSLSPAPTYPKERIQHNNHVSTLVSLINVHAKR